MVADLTWPISTRYGRYCDADDRKRNPQGLRNRYDSMKAAIDILRDQNTGYLQVVKEIERLYESAQTEQGRYADCSKEWREFERYTDALPPEAWIA